MCGGSGITDASGIVVLGNTQQPLTDIRRDGTPKSRAVAQVWGRGRSNAGESRRQRFPNGNGRQG